MATTHRATAGSAGARIDTLSIDPDDLAALEAVGESPDGEGWTTTELCDATSHCRKWVADRLKALRLAGKLHIGRRQVEYIDGRRSYVPVYWWD